MNKEEKVKKGQKVYVTGDKELQECTVKSSGSKYITLEELHNIKDEHVVITRIGAVLNTLVNRLEEVKK